MRAFWWFEKNTIAGMARPGFNHVRWFDLPFIEAVAMGWIGQHSTGSHDLKSFRRHLNTYAPKMFRFYNLDEQSGPVALKVFDESTGLDKVLKQLATRTLFIDNVEVSGDSVRFEVSKKRLELEAQYLKSHGIGRVVSLTESHHDKEYLNEHFELHHIGIEDLNAPNIEQVYELAKIIDESKSRGQTLAVHCLAGIGRTSTMLMAAHIIKGATIEDMHVHIARQNPSFVLTGSQGEFIKSVANMSLPR